MPECVRTDSLNPDFISLVSMLDRELAERDGKDHSFYAQFNTIQKIRHAIVRYVGNKPVACGAIREFSPSVMEVKRMFVLPEYRGKGLAKAVLTELENWATEMHYDCCILETGKRQPEAISLYTKSGYHIIPNYGQYVGMENSVCFEKKLTS
jgi:GNAT superfamily N-acetyltransferase